VLNLLTSPPNPFPPEALEEDPATPRTTSTEAIVVCATPERVKSTFPETILEAEGRMRERVEALVYEARGRVREVKPGVPFDGRDVGIEEVGIGAARGWVWCEEEEVWERGGLGGELARGRVWEDERWIALEFEFEWVRVGDLDADLGLELDLALGAVAAAVAVTPFPPSKLAEEGRLSVLVLLLPPPLPVTLLF
jgi:hypothetical protein